MKKLLFVVFALVLPCVFAMADVGDRVLKVKEDISRIVEHLDIPANSFLYVREPQYLFEGDSTYCVNAVQLEGIDEIKVYAYDRSGNVSVYSTDVQSRWKYECLRASLLYNINNPEITINPTIGDKSPLYAFVYVDGNGNFSGWYFTTIAQHLFEYHYMDPDRYLQNKTMLFFLIYSMIH